MSTWTSPVTFTASTLTAALMNSEVRDHATFLKGALDLITNSTTADTGDTVQLRIKRAAASSTAHDAGVTGDTVMRFQLRADGSMYWGPGAAAAIDTGPLERVSAGVLRLTGTLQSAQATSSTNAFSATVTGDAVSRWAIQSSGRMQWGDGAASQDVALYRYGVDILAVDDQFRVLSTSGVVVIGASGNSSFRAYKVDSDAQPSFQVKSDGTVSNGAGGASAPTQILTTRQTGWAAATNTKARTTFDTTTVTLPNLAARVGALIDDLITHGLIGA